MKRVLAVVPLAVLTFAVAATAAEEKPLESRIASIGLFKNGLAVVRRTVTVPGSGVYRLDDVPRPVHGTYWVESDAKVATRLSHRLVEVTADRTVGADFQEELAGRRVTVYFAGEGIPPASGTVVELDQPRGDAVWSRNYQQPRYGYRGRTSVPGGQDRMLVLETEKGRSYVDTSRIVQLQVAGTGNTVRRRKPVMLFDVDTVKQKPATIAITYLVQGMAWAPSYRVDITDPKRLVLQQKAVLKNELESFKDAKIQLISGFPSIQFANVTSPLSLETNWANFFQQLNQRYSPSHAAMSNAVTQQVAFNRNDPGSGIDLSAVPTGEGVDLHYQDVGRRTMDEGDSLALETARAEADYERIVEWIVPDTRTANGRHISENELRNNPDQYKDAAWDAVRFRNPLEFPMTTAPAMIVAAGRFNGQRLSYWVNPGEETSLHVTKALSVRTRSVEQEVKGTREDVSLYSHRYYRMTVEGELRANNHRKEPIELVIRRRFSGDLVSADREPKLTLLEEGVYSVNKRNQLTWNLTLQPGQDVKLLYRYKVLVWH